MKRFLFTMAAFLVFCLTAASQEYPASESALGSPNVTTAEHSQGSWIMLLDKNGGEIWYELHNGYDDFYVTTLTLFYETYGSFNPDPALTDEENELNRPQVPFRFVVDGTVWGADEAMKEAVIDDDSVIDKLFEGSDGFYTIPVGYFYALGIKVDEANGEYSVGCYRGPQPSPWDFEQEVGWWIMLLDKNGHEVWKELHQGADGAYVTTVTADDTYSDWIWDPDLSDEENELNRPRIPFRFVVNNTPWGADEARKVTVMDNEYPDNEENKLYKGMCRGYYTIPFCYGYSYALGIFPDEATGEYYVYCLQGKPVHSVDEVNAGKTIAGKRYFNQKGQEMPQADGLTIVVTTYTDGTTIATKLIK